MLFTILACLITLFVICGVLSEERFRSAVLLAIAAFLTFIAIDVRFDSLEARTAEMIEVAGTEELPIVWVKTEIAANDSIFGLCAQATSGSDMRPCIWTFVHLNRDQFPTEAATEEDYWLDEGQQYVIPTRLAQTE